MNSTWLVLHTSTRFTVKNHYDWPVHVSQEQLYIVSAAQTIYIVNGNSRDRLILLVALYSNIYSQLNLDNIYTLAILSNIG